MRIWAILVAGVCVASGAAFALSPTQGAPNGSEARNLMAQLRSEGARARERAAAFDRQAQTATQASDRAKLAAAALGARVQQSEAALAGADAALALLSDQRRALASRLAAERAPVVRLLAGLQTQVRRPPLLTLLQPGSTADAVHLRAALAAIGPRIVARTGSLRVTLERSRRIEDKAARAAAGQRRFRAELQERRTELATLSATERLKAQRAAGAADREAERAFALAARARDPGTLARRLGADNPPPARDAAAIPESGPSPFRLPVSGRREPKGDQGVAIFAPPGALIVAPGAGRVAYAGPFRGYGSIVIIEHAGGWTSLVTGLGAMQVAVGQQLVAGSPLGQAPGGNPSIGLELRRNGQRVDPLDQLR